ncbi:hypothetical protein TCAL_13056 [Tigriopus californicus]|uniref:Corticotropin-releasing factor domain-containing protein n=1 Tax=Tigriopus californicus TaxID=6832 RepID=A0A553PSX5_TIGCA|nr:uncharacterized protein LOC131891895 [Tigriopus californicus]TRY80780.1 hypothetical protein TCAL_13056 [Tigriopus californicus]|eukprot:TCALIF_13056-PA protein Name:"Protein of unknown function" AED:0.00 eAED:0.00 QI:134/1/1/1/0.66/0.5/4/352/149
MRGCSPLYVLVVVILNQVADGRRLEHLEYSRPMANAPMANKAGGISKFLEPKPMSPQMAFNRQALAHPRMPFQEVIHHPLARRSSSVRQFNFEDEQYLMEALLEGLEFERQLKSMLEPGLAKREEDDLDQLLGSLLQKRQARSVEKAPA